MAQAPSAKMEEHLEARAEAVRGDWLVTGVALVVATLLMGLAAYLVGPINTIRQEQQFTLDTESLEGLPPDVALMTKTGTLRALAIDAGFQRLEELKQQNRFYELMQLSDWMCKLAPRYPSVWSYAAWNMAYNISVCQYTAEARWLWVRNGIECLRSRGIPYNPNSITLYKELAWIFFHKIGDKLDDEHRAYKTELAVDMQIIMGDPPVGKTITETLEEFRKIKDAPRDWRTPEDLIAVHPEWKKLYDDLKAAGLGLNKDLLRAVAIAREKSSARSTFRSTADTTSPSTTPATSTSTTSTASVEAEAKVALARQRAESVINNPIHAAALAELLPVVRSHVIRNDLNMNLEWMYQLMADPPWVDEETKQRWIEVYGPDSYHCPIDWRTPWAQTLYWGTYGDIKTRNALNLNSADQMNAVRFIFFALESMARTGVWIIEPNYDRPNRSFYQALPDTRFIKHMHQAYLHYGEIQFGHDPRFIRGTSGPNYWGGHRNFLLDAIQQLYFRGEPENIAEAKSYFFYLKELDRELDGSVKKKYQGTFEQFVFTDIAEDLDTQVRAQMFIAELLARSLRDAGDGDIKRSVAHFQEAKRWWNYYMRDKKDMERNARRALQPLGIMRRDVAMLYLATPQNSPWQKARVWGALDLLTRQSIYDSLLPIVTEQCQAYDPPYDASKVLPQPPGMEEYREKPERSLKALEIYDETVDQGEKINEE